ncbi:MAG TPA: hypothetical protein VLA05_12580 [Coriobacteriia bacterium]|nr:hypothetical protein [Coriobacteriia bacterium]
MSGEQGGDKPEEETNFYLVTLKGCHDTLIPNAMDAVYDGVGDPGKPIADAINGGGWECSQADTWVTELLQHTNKVMPAFEDARSAVSTEMAAERGAHGGDTVPKDHPHGVAWNRTWHIRRHNL